MTDAATPDDDTAVDSLAPPDDHAAADSLATPDDDTAVDSLAPPDDHAAADSLPRVLLIGLPASAVDRSQLPEEITVADLAARIEKGFGAVKEAGFDAVNLLIDPDPDAAAAQLTETLGAGAPFDAVLIGGGIRMIPTATPLFERIINELRVQSPGSALCFNTAPTNSIDALRRVV